jgi:type IV secretory pathway VirJ component
VLEVDLPAYLAALRQSDDRDCHYLISEVEEARKRVQRELGVDHYLSPILAGTGMGAALAYAALAQAPAVTVAGAASDGLATELDIRLPLCPGAPPTPAPMGSSTGSRPSCQAGGGSRSCRRKGPKPNGSWPTSARRSWWATEIMRGAFASG